MAKIYIASDHAGYSLKLGLIPHLNSLAHEVVDVGPHNLDPNDDYPDFIIPCAEKVAGDPGSFGIIIGKSGQGEAMAANRIHGVRAALFYGGNQETIRLTREHNDANIISLGAGFITETEAKAAVRLFLETPFSNEPRHKRRLSEF